MADGESEVDALKREVTSWRDRCEAAANLGKQLVVSKAALQDENAELKRQVEQLRHLEHANTKDDSARRVQELLARVRALQDQLHDAELLNQQLSKELQQKDNSRPRSAANGARRSDDSVRHSGTAARNSEDTVSRDEVDVLRKQLEAAEARAERAEAKEQLLKQLGSKLDEQTVVNVTLKASLARAEERTAAAEKELAVARKELFAHDDEAVHEMRNSQSGQHLKWLAEANNDSLLRAVHATATDLSGAQPYAASREGLWAALAIVRWRQMVECKTESARLAHEVRKLKEDKEMAEERFAALRAAGGTRRDSADSSGSIAGEAQVEEDRWREKEEARRAIEALRTRTQEAELARKQIQMTVKEADRLRDELVSARAGQLVAEKRAMDAEIEMEIWRERGVKWKAYLTELAN